MKVSLKIFLKNKDGKILALRRSATDPRRPLTWDLPGGNIEEGEVMLDGLKREIFEETGLEASDIKIFDAMSDNYKGGYHIQISYTGKVDNEDVKLSDEHDEYRWLTKEEFLALESSVKIKAFLQKM